MEPRTFFDEVRKTIFKGKMSVAQVGGVNTIIAAWEKYGYGLHTELAYELATAHWETGARMVPVRETFASSDDVAIRRLDAAWKAGKLGSVSKPYWRDGWFGRGLVQITHEDNYAGRLRDAVLKEFGVDIHKHPEATLREDIAAFLLIEGVTKGVTLKSDYTGYALEDFINESKTDYLNARKTVNPGDKKSYGPIADVALKFETALRKAVEAAGEEFKGPIANLYDGKYHEEVEGVQKTLAEKGYPVGDIDGRWGRLTRQAVLSFRADNDLPAKENISDKDFLAALVISGQRTLSGTRTQATVADLRAKGSEAIKTADKVDWTGRLMLGGAGLGAADQALDTAEKYSDYAQRFKALVDPVTSIIHDNFFLILAGLGGVIIYQAIKHKKLTTEKYQKGENITA